MDDVLTLMASPGGLPAPLVARLALECGATRIDWLAPGEAADLLFDAGPPPAPADLAQLVGDAPIDAVCQQRQSRRRLLLVADMDSTLVTGETLDELAVFAGVGAQVAAITARSMNGEIDFEQALLDRVLLLRGLDAAALDRSWQDVRFTGGAQALGPTMRAHGAFCAIASGGFTFYTARVAEQLGFDAHFANALEIQDGRLTGRLTGTVLGRQGKRDVLHTLAAKRGLAPASTMAVGDGANDLEMLAAAGAGIAFHARPVVAGAARMRVDHCDLRALLFLQGYRPPADGGPVWS